jgi:hypothetical protein
MVFIPNPALLSRGADAECSRREGIDCRYGQSKSDAHTTGRHQQDGVGKREIVHHPATQDEQRHCQQIGGQSEQADALNAHPLC